jgi:hypothetical protein
MEVPYATMAGALVVSELVTFRAAALTGAMSATYCLR